MANENEPNGISSVIAVHSGIRWLLERDASGAPVRLPASQSTSYKAVHRAVLAVQRRRRLSVVIVVSNAFALATLHVDHTQPLTASQPKWQQRRAKNACVCVRSFTSARPFDGGRVANQPKLENEKEKCFIAKATRVVPSSHSPHSDEVYFICACTASDITLTPSLSCASGELQMRASVFMYENQWAK